MSQLKRIDKFRVPAESLDELLAALRDTHRVIDELPGVISNDVAHLTAGNSRFNVVTVVTWESQAAHEAAGQVMAERARRRGFDKSEFLVRLGVELDSGLYGS